MHLTVLACGLGGAAFVSDLLTWREASSNSTDVTIVAGTAEDITLCGLRFCPELDAVADLLSPEADSPGRVTHAVRDELRRWDALPHWFPADDRTFARAIARSRWLGSGVSLSQTCDRMAAVDARARLLPMSDQPVEAHVVLDDGDSQRAVHAREWASTRMSGDDARPVRISAAGLASATPAPGVLEAIRGATAVLVPLTAPVTGLGVMLGLPGVRDALRGTSAQVIGVGPTLLPVRGDETATLQSLDLDYTSRDVAGLYADILDGCVVPDAELDAARSSLRDTAVRGIAEPLPGVLAGAAVRLAGEISEEVTS